jgi:hypothetical protein
MGWGDIPHHKFAGQCGFEIAVFVFSVLAPWWPSQESDWTEIWSVSYSILVVHMYKVSGQ